MGREHERRRLEDSYAYGGSFADAALLGAFGHPRVVNPDPRLATLAATRRWPVRWFDVPPGVVKVAGRELQEWLRPLANEQLVTNAQIEISGRRATSPPAARRSSVFNHRSYFDATVVGMLLAKSGRSAAGHRQEGGLRRPDHRGVRPRLRRHQGGPGHRVATSRCSGPRRRLRAGELIMIAPEGTIPRGLAFFEPELKARWGTARLAHAPGRR